MEEAKKYANENKMQSKEIKNVEKQEIKSKKKSWKTAFFSFWKSSSNKKAKQQYLNNETKNGSKNYPKRSGHFSGPVWSVTGGGQRVRVRVRHQASGPLMGLFNQMKGKEGEKNEISYVSLESLNRPAYDAKTYGPLYLVS